MAVAPIPPLSFSAGGGGPSAAGGTTNNGFDSSGWAVNFGSGSASATGSSDGFASLATGYTPYIVGAVVLVVLWRLKKKRS